ncbi:MAG: helix-turn-helix domain-containing protein [Spirochaetales bacterium]|nr:helix-turn-helix domain-containing protein [Spirochaetales bacterium]
MKFDIFPAKSKTNLYLRMLLFLALLSLIVISIAIISSTFAFEKKLLEKNYENYMEDLNQVNLHLSSLNSSVKALALQIYFDRDSAALRSYGDPDVIKINNAITETSLAGAVLPYVKSIYIYNHISEMIYTISPLKSSSSSRIEDFKDLDIISTLKNISSIKPLKPYARLIPSERGMDEKEYWKGLTFCFHNQHKGNQPVEGAIFINVTQKWIEDLIPRKGIDSGVETYIFTQDGRLEIGFDSGSTADMNDLLKEISKDQEESGYFINRINNDKSLILYSRFEPFQWTIIRKIPSHYLLPEIHKARFLAVISGVITLLAGLIPILIISKQMYKPVKSILLKMKGLEEDAEFALQFKKEKYLKSCLLGAHEQIDNMSLEKMGISFTNDSKLTTALISIDDNTLYYSLYNTQDREKIKKFLKETLQKQIGSSKLELISPSEDQLLLISPYHSFLNEKSRRDFLHELEEYKKLIQEQTEISISIIISQDSATIDRLKENYGELLKCLGNRFFRGYGILSFTDEFPERKNYDFIYPLKSEQSILEAASHGNLKGMEKGFENFKSKVIHSSPITVKHALERLSAAIFSRISVLEKSYGDPFPHNFEDTADIIEKEDLLVNIEVQLNRLFNSIADYCVDNFSLKQQQTVKRVEEMINTEYPNRNLGMSMIAEKMNMSPGYLGRLYKSISGNSVVDSINEIRMEKARELLSERDKSVNEIIEETGYSSSQHFHRVFKKMTGLSPSGYRSAQNNNS